jgi:hypothetical protein
MAARLIAILLLVAACGDSKSAPTSSSVKAAAAQDPYLRGLAQLEPLEREALEAVGQQTGAHYTTDEALLAALRQTAIPRYREYLEGLKKLPTPGGEKTPLHQKLVVLAGAELAALEALVVAVEKGDGFAVLEVNREQRRIAEEMERLAAEFVQPGSSTPSSSTNDASR